MLQLRSSTEAVEWLKSLGARGLCTDHRRVRPGDAFLAWPGRHHDARLHAGAALAAGAVACLIEPLEVPPMELQREPKAGSTDAQPQSVHHAFTAPQTDNAAVAALCDLKPRAGEVADAFLGHPSRTLDVVAVTGTNGKTSSTWWLAQALGALGRACGVVGTLGVGDPRKGFDSTGLTTPDAVALQAAFRRFADEGLQACAIEASSIGIVERRLAGSTLAVAAFTNLTQDHLDYHGTMAAYGAAKRALFDMTGLRAAVLNVDDLHGRAWAAELQGRPGLEVWTVSAAGSGPGSIQGATQGAARGLGQAPRLWARDVRHTAEGLELVLVEHADADLPAGGQALRTPLIGGFNVENLLVVAGCLRALGVPLADVTGALAQLTPVPGRLQRVLPVGAAAQPALVVDYAHTPDALHKALQALAPLAAARGGQLWCVFGCGGDRDAAKRPLMGQAAVQGASHVVVTSDNPRSEDPASILAQIMGGAMQVSSMVVPSLLAIEDRRAAIAHAVRRAAPADVVLIAGKGHEQTQEIAGVKHPFCDVAEATAALAQRAAASAAAHGVEARP